MVKKSINKKINMLSPKSLEFKSREEDGRWEYLDKINDAINDKDGYNIAISGAYGTGKSSIVKSYIEHYKMENKVLKINIGSFLKAVSKNDETSKNNQNKDQNLKEENDTIMKNNNSEDDGILSHKEELLMQKVEKTIVKQLIYTTKNSKSKLSSINRLQSRWQLKYMFYSFSITYMLICLHYFFIDKKLISKLVSDLFNIINKVPFIAKLSVDSFIPFFRILFFVDTIAIIIKFIYYLFTVFNKAKTKMKIKNYELEIDNTTSSKFSFMDNLYEILYSFMNSSIEVVFFEDIDRYQKDVCIKIIEDLKELNLIINSCHGMNHKWFGRKKVVFVYSFKDGIFYDYTEKNKFYDYIVSIMPVSTRYNSQMHLINELNNIDISVEKLNGELLNITSLHITDLRTIKNIVNDFDLFLKVLKIDNNKFDINQLFALCVYKNYDIEGYDKLIEYDNPIDKVLLNLGEVVDEEVEKDIIKTKDEISSLKKKKVEKKENIFSSNTINGEFPQYLVVGGEEITYNQFMDDKFDIKKMNNNSIYINHNNEILDFNYETEMSDFVNYIVECDDKIYDLNFQLKSLEQVFDSDNNDENLFNYSKKYIEEVQLGSKKLNSKISIELYQSLLFVLVYSGFIRTDYIDYITSPIDSEYLSLRDSRFIFGYNHQRFDFSSKIDHPGRVLNYLGKNCYSNPYILNNDILKFVFDTKDDNKKSLIEQFNKMTNEKLDFLNQLSKRDSITYKKVIREISSNFSIVWDNYCKQTDNAEIMKTYNRCSIIVELATSYVGKILDVEKKARLKSLISYYANHNNIILISSNGERDSSNNVIDSLKKLGVQFINISKIVNDDDKVLDIIVKEDLFELNKENIMFILSKEGKINEQTVLNYAIIKTSKYAKYLERSIVNHIDKFSLNLYLNDNIEKFIIDDSELIKEILINTNDELLIKEILKRELFTINGYELPIKYISLAFEYNHIVINWKTISLYSTGSYSEDNDLFNLALDNIESFYNRNTSAIKNIPSQFIKRLIDSLFKDKKYQITDVILKNYNCSRLEKYNIYKFTPNEEIIQKIKYNIVLFSKLNFNKISRIVNREIKYIYLRNLIEAHDISKVIDLIDIQTLIDFKDSFFAYEIFYILNKNIKRSSISTTEIEAIIKSVFKSKKRYSITYKKEYIDNIISKVEYLFSECIHERGLIIFTLK